MLEYLLMILTRIAACTSLYVPCLYTCAFAFASLVRLPDTGALVDQVAGPRAVSIPRALSLLPVFLTYVLVPLHSNLTAVFFRLPQYRYAS
jgi:hypothetical protein